MNSDVATQQMFLLKFGLYACAILMAYLEPYLWVDSVSQFEIWGMKEFHVWFRLVWRSKSIVVLTVDGVCTYLDLKAASVCSIPVIFYMVFLVERDCFLGSN